MTSLGADRDIERSREHANRKCAHEIEIAGSLSEFERAGIKARRTRGAQGRVHRVGDVEVEAVVSVHSAQVVSPAKDIAFHAHSSRIVVDLAVDQGKEAVGINRAHVVVVGSDAPIARALAVASADAAEGVDLRAVSECRKRPIEEAAKIVHVRIALAEIHVVQKSGIGVSGISREVLWSGIGKRPVGRAAVLILSGDVKESSVVYELPRIQRDRVDVAVGQLVVSGKPFQPGVILSRLVFRVGRFVRLENDVDDARYRVGSVLRGRAIAQDLDALDRAGRNRIQIDTRRAAADRAVDVDERAGMTTLAVDEYQHLIGTESAQRRRTDVISSVGNRRPRKIEGWRQQLDDLARLDLARRLDLGRRQNVNGHRRVENRPIVCARADDNRGVELGDPARQSIVSLQSLIS